MQVHIVGAQNTGKTFLISRVIDEFRARPLAVPVKLQELRYRKEAREGRLATNGEGTVDSQREILRLIMEDIRPTKEVTIVDRCPLDNLAYTYALHWRALTCGRKDSEEFDSFVSESRKKIRAFYSGLADCGQSTTIFYLPICGCVDVPLVERAGRDLSDESHRRMVDSLMFRVLHDSEFEGLFDVRILTGTIDQKLLSVRRTLSSIVG